MPAALLLFVLLVASPDSGLVLHGARDSGRVALTFDACPARTYSAGVAETLTDSGVPATFFLSGRWIARFDSEALALAANPLFEFGNHSWNHPHCRNLGLAQFDAEILRTDSALRRLTSRVRPWFRFPYGESDRRTRQEATRLGFIVIQWDVASGDAAFGLSARAIARNVLARATGGSIIIMHVNGRCTHTAEAIPLIVAGLREKGLEIVPLSVLLEPDTGQR